MIATHCTDEAAATASRFGGIIVQGGVTSGSSMRFRAPVRPNDEITAEAEVLTIKDGKPICTLRTTITNQDGTVVLDGTAVVYQEPLAAGASSGGNRR